MVISRSPARSSGSLSASLDIIPVTEAQLLRVTRPPDQWTAEDVAAYVAEEVTRATGPQLPAREARAVLEGFCERFTVPVAVRIARAAFEVYNGMWEGAPVTWKRFSESHDGFFARPILEAMH